MVDEAFASDLTGNSGIMRNLPMRDYPLFVTDKKVLEII